MSLFNFSNKTTKTTNQPVSTQKDQAEMSVLALKTITDGVVIINNNGIILFINPAAVTMTGFKSIDDTLGLNYLSVIKLENQEGLPVPEAENPIANALRTGQPFYTRNFLLTTDSIHHPSIALNIIPVKDPSNNTIITFRNITKEIEEENAQTEFISTASHEMRTPVASIEGYLGLALNPQTATIDDRARQYLDAAHKASQHLGHLFQNLLDTTKLDDKKIKLRFVPVDITKLTKTIADSYIQKISEKQLHYIFGTEPQNHEKLTLPQVVYGSVDLNFFQAALGNIIENAIKYTEAGGTIGIGVRGDKDKALISISDTGIGIAADDLAHIFQKFYRADNSQTQTIGGTGLGLYIAKQRIEAMDGHIWAESTIHQGTTFYISLPRISAEEFERRMLVYRNEQSTIIANTQTAQSNTPPNPITNPASSPILTTNPASTPTQPQ